MTAAAMLELYDLDLLIAELTESVSVRRLERMGFSLPELRALERARLRIETLVDARWLQHYARARARYGRGLAAVRGRVCLGCFVTLPTSATPAPGSMLTVCESCGRVLYWE